MSTDHVNANDDKRRTNHNYMGSLTFMATMVGVHTVTRPVAMAICFDLGTTKHFSLLAQSDNPRFISNEEIHSAFC